jgi:hypothetical protein
LPGEDTADGRDQVVVLSHAFWQRRFAGDSRGIGGRLALGAMSYAIVGVAPQRFEGSSAGWAPDISVPTRAVVAEADERDAVGSRGRIASSIPRFRRQTGQQPFKHDAPTHQLRTEG